MFEATSKIVLLKHVIQNFEEEIYNKTRWVWKPYRHSIMSTCKWEETKAGAEYKRNSQLPNTQPDR